MEYRQLGKTDLKVSSIGLGCVTFGREIDQDMSFKVMDRALERGIRLFDTAEVYGHGNSEQVIGNWMADRGTRDQIVLATKVHGTLTRERVLSSADESLERLQTDCVDLFQVHLWDPVTPLEETVEALHTLVEQGKTRYIGCSNYSAWQLCKALRLQDANGWSEMASVQPNYNLVTRDIEQDLLPLCVDQQVGVTSYSPLGAGFLTGKYREGAPPPIGARFEVMPGHQDIYFYKEKFRIMEGLRAKSQELGISMIHLALAWAFGQPAITTVLAGARSPGHVDQAFTAEAMGMSPELRAELSNL